MNGVLNSEAKLFRSYKHSYTESKGLQIQDNFSDLVPAFATVEGVFNSGLLSLNQLNPVTASNLSHTAVMISSVEKFSDTTSINTLGAGSSCAPAVAFFNTK